MKDFGHMHKHSLTKKKKILPENANAYKEM